MRIIKYLSISFLILFFSACSLTSPMRYIKVTEIIENNYVSFKTPNKNWEGFKNYKVRKKRNRQLSLYNYSPKGAEFAITIHTGLLKRKLRNFDNTKINKTFYERNKDSFKERGIHYAKADTQYIKGMKCGVQVRAGENILKENGNTMKRYDTWCGYYDKTEKLNDGKRRFRISYSLKYYPGNQRLQKDKNTPSNQIKSRDELELQLKNEVKKLISTLKIKNFDKEKMIKEGLYHPKSKYENMKW